MCAQWRRIEQEEAFPGRCAEVGDELGSQVVAARLVREIMHGDRFATALERTISDDEVKHLSRVGKTTQWADSTDVLSNPRWCGPLSALYAESVANS